MSGTVIVGFTPVVPAISAGGPVIAGAPAGEAAESPLGLFDTLLALVTAETAETPAIPGLPPETTPASPALPELATVPETPELPAEAAPLLGDLVDLLAALDEAVQNGRPPDPALRKKLDDNLEAIAALLGLPLPQPPTVDPAITAAATISAVPVVAPEDLILPSPVLPEPQLPAPIESFVPAAPPAAGSPEPLLPAPVEPVIAAAPETGFAPVTAPLADNGPDPTPLPTEIPTATAALPPASLVAASVGSDVPAPTPAVTVAAPVTTITTPVVEPVPVATAAPPITQPVSTIAPTAVDTVAEIATATPTPNVVAPVAPAIDAGLAPPAASPASAAKPAIELSSPLGKLVARIETLAAAIDPVAPALSQKLRAVAEKLSSGQIDTETLTALGLDADLAPTDPDLDQALRTLLSVRPPPREVPAPPIFAPVDLKTPSFTPPQRIAAPEPAPPPALPDLGDIEPELEPRPELRLATVPRAPERPDAIEAPSRPQASFGALLNAVTKADNAAADPVAQSTTAPAPQTAPVVPAGTKAIHAAYQAPVQQINMPQVAFEVVRQFQAGSSRFQIRLDPPELGRIDVRMDVDKSGNVHARMTVERAETLDLMQRDQRSLERALGQAGLDSGKTNLEFSLRQNPFAHDGRGDGRDPQTPFQVDPFAEPDEGIAPTPEINHYRGSASPSGVNLFV